MIWHALGRTAGLRLVEEVRVRPVEPRVCRAVAIHSVTILSNSAVVMRACVAVPWRRELASGAFGPQGEGEASEPRFGAF